MSLTDDEIRELLLHNKNQETAELCVEALALRARVKVLEEALRDISKQKIMDEMTGAEAAHADWIGGYERCIEIARTALQEQSK
jgi:hypothetical protein